MGERTYFCIPVVTRSYLVTVSIFFLFIIFWSLCHASFSPCQVLVLLTMWNKRAGASLTTPRSPDICEPWRLTNNKGDEFKY